MNQYNIMSLNEDVNVKMFQSQNNVIYQSKDILNGDISSSGSSIRSLKDRIRSVPVPTLSERLAAFDRQLQWNEWKWRVHQQVQLTNHAEETEESDYTSSKQKLDKIKEMLSENYENRPKNALKSSTRMPVRSSIPKLNTANRQNGTVYHSKTTEFLKKRLNEMLSEVQTGKTEVPLLPEKIKYRSRSRSLDSRPIESKQKQSITSPKASQSSSKIPQFPRIKSRSNSEQSLARKVAKSKLPLSFEDGKIKSLYLRKDPMTDRSSSSATSSFSDRPRSSKRICAKETDSNSVTDVTIPLLNIRSLSGSIDSSETYRISSITNRTVKLHETVSDKSKSSTDSNSNKCTCFRTSDTSAEIAALSSRSNRSIKSPKHCTKEKRRSISKIPVRVNSTSTSLSNRSKSSSSDRSDNSHVSEYESKTMLMVTSSTSHGLICPIENLIPAVLVNVSKENSVTSAEATNLTLSRLKSQDLKEDNPKLEQNASNQCFESKISVDKATQHSEDFLNEVQHLSTKGIQISKRNVETETDNFYWEESDERKIVDEKNKFVEKIEGVEDAKINESKVKVDEAKKKLNCPAETKRDTDRFSFRMEQMEEGIVQTDCADQFAAKNDAIEKHPTSLIRLANVDLDLNSSDIVNYLSMTPRTMSFDKKHQGFFARLKKRFGKKSSHEHIRLKNFHSNYELSSGNYCMHEKCSPGDFMKNENISKSVVRSKKMKIGENKCEKFDDIEEIFKNDDALKNEDSVNQFDCVSEISLFKDKKEKKNSPKKYEKPTRQILNETFPHGIELERSFNSNGCLCFKWC